jgi:hypothetical protein
MPFVALALVLVYGLGHVHGTLRLFVGYVTLMVLAGALPPAMRLAHTLRVGSLRVRGAIVQRLDAPRRFWTWVAFEGFCVAWMVVGGAFLAWATLNGVTPM